MSRSNTSSSQEDEDEDFSKQNVGDYENIQDHSPLILQAVHERDTTTKIIQIIQTRSFEDDEQDLSLILTELDKFDHFTTIKNEEGYQELLKECLDHLEYEFIPKGKFLFHYGDIGEKFYFIAKGNVSIHVPMPNKEIFKQEKNYQLRKYWEDQIERQDIQVNERETAKLHYQRAREKIFKYLEKYQHDQFYKKLINGHPTNKKFIKKYFHEQYKTFGLYKKVNQLKEGQSFGEVATISRKLRTASVFAEEDLHLFYLRGKDYLTIFSQQLYKLNFVLKNVEKYFENLSKKQILDLSYLFDAFEHTLHLNQVIFKEGQDRQYIYLIKTGSVAFKSSRGISLGIIGEGEFFGFENKKGEDSSLFNEKHTINATCIANGTIVYKLKVQLLQEDGLQAILKEFSQKGFVKAEYYTKRAQHCQNIFEQTEANNPFHQELQNYNDFGQSPKASLKQSDSPFLCSKNIKKLMNKLQIQKKFLKYIEENQNSQQSQIQTDRSKQNEANEDRKSFSQKFDQVQGSMSERVKQNKSNQIVSFGSSAQLIENNPDQKAPSSSTNLISRSSITRLSLHRNSSHKPQTNTNDSVIRSSNMLSSQKLSTPAHISNKVNENEISINQFLTSDQINSLNYNSHFKQKYEASTSQSMQRLSLSQQQKSNEVIDNKFQFISKEEFEQTKQNIIKEQEKLRARKSQHFMPQELADMSLCKKISQRYLSSGSLHTPQQAKPQVTLSNFFHHSASSLKIQPQSSSPLIDSIEQPSGSPLKTLSNFAGSPLKISTDLPISPPKLYSHQQSSSSQIQFNYPSSPNQEHSNYQCSPFKVLQDQQLQQSSSIEGQQFTFFPSQDANKSQFSPEALQGGGLFGQKRRLTSISPVNKRNSVDCIVEQNMKLENRRSCIGLMISPKKVSNKSQENKIDKQKVFEDALILQPSTTSTSHLSIHQQSPIALKQKISTFSYSSFSNNQQKINMNNSCKNIQSSSQTNPQIQSNQNKSPKEISNPEQSQEINVGVNFVIPQTFSYAPRYSKDEIIQKSPQNKQLHQKNQLSMTSSIFQDVSAAKETINKFNKTCNQLLDKKVKNSLAITDLNNPQNSRPSITSLTLKSFTDFNPNSARNSVNNQNSPLILSSHRRSFSQIQTGQQDQVITSTKKEVKNKQYSQLFKKSNESKSLKKKQKIMPLVRNESDNASNLVQNQQSSPNQYSGLFVNTKQASSNGLPEIGMKTRVPSFVLHQSLNNLQVGSSNMLSSQVLQGDVQINQNNKKKSFRNGSILLPITSNFLSSQSPQMQRKKSLPFCSVKSIFDSCKDLSPGIESDLTLKNKLIKNN